MNKKLKPTYTFSEILNSKISLIDFDFKTLGKKVFNFVYKPGDDSYLLLYTVYTDLLRRKLTNDLLFVEIG